MRKMADNNVKTPDSRSAVAHYQRQEKKILKKLST